LKESHSVFTARTIDNKFWKFKDEGVYPAEKGSYFMYHRIDGRLVGVGVLDVLKTHLDSGYFIYDPEFSFLNLGVVSAIREIEFMRMAKRQFNQDMQYY